MSQYILAYQGGAEPKTPEEGAKSMASWRAWVSNLGEAIVNPGTPLGEATSINAQGVSKDGASTFMTGFSMVQADNMEAALQMAKSCPYLELANGTIVVAEVKEMA